MNPRESNRVAFGYARVQQHAGSNDPGSLERQVQAITEFAQLRGYQVEMFSDWSSGEADDLAARPGLQRLMDLVPAMRPEIMIVASVGPLSGSPSVVSQVFRLLVEHEVGFLSLSDSGFDLRWPHSGLLLSVLASFAGYLGERR